MANIADETRDHLQDTAADLKKQASKMGATIAARASDAMETAEDALEDGKRRASDVVRHVREQGHVAAEVARENPGTTATVLATVGLLGLVAGLLLGGAFASARR